MSKVRGDHEYVFIAKITDVDNILEKYHFNFNHKLVPNNSDTRRKPIWIIKGYSMNLIAEICFDIDDANSA
jgi:hypothetical protein